MLQEQVLQEWQERTNVYFSVWSLETSFSLPRACGKLNVHGTLSTRVGSYWRVTRVACWRQESAQRCNQWVRVTASVEDQQHVDLLARTEVAELYSNNLQVRRASAGIKVNSTRGLKPEMKQTEVVQWLYVSCFWLTPKCLTRALRSKCS